MARWGGEGRKGDGERVEEWARGRGYRFEVLAVVGRVDFFFYFRVEVVVVVWVSRGKDLGI